MLIGGCGCYSDGRWGSAVCAYSLSKINSIFDTGDFLEKRTEESAWQPAPADTVAELTHRPGQVRTGGLSRSQIELPHILLQYQADRLAGKHVFSVELDKLP